MHHSPVRNRARCDDSGYPVGNASAAFGRAIRFSPDYFDAGMEPRNCVGIDIDLKMADLRICKPGRKTVFAISACQAFLGV